jgi:hypothetical protein
VAASVDGSGGGGVGVDGSCGSSGAAVMFGGDGGARWHVWRLSRKPSSDDARGRRHSGRGGSDGDAAREAAGTLGGGGSVMETAASVRWIWPAATISVGRVLRRASADFC